MKFKLIILFLVLSITKINSQWKSEWFPSDLNIQPFTANFLEPKAGFHFLVDPGKVRIDIGTSRDIILFKSDAEQISIGADLFTYTRTRTESNFKFPVETVDYLFGINSGYKINCGSTEWGARFRFSHISAHLVDGNYDSKNNEWRGGRDPFVYSKEFFEIIGYYKIVSLRIYTGITYNIHIIPNEIKKVTFQAGFDYYAKSFSSFAFIPFIAYDFKLTGIDKYSGNHVVAGGVKFGEPTSRGFSILVSYLAGKSVHGEFFDLNENYLTLGINLDI